jgi:hypothetical protein
MIVDMHFDYDFFRNEGFEGAEQFLDHLADEYELELPPHIAEVVVGAMAAGACYTSWSESDVLEALGALRSVADSLERAIETQVILCRAYVCTWSSIGEQLGVSRQAAEQRYGRAAWFGDEGEQAELEAATELLEARLDKVRAETRLHQLEHGPGTRVPDEIAEAMKGLFWETIELGMRRRKLANERMRRRRGS